ncbi:hypothetical protein K493DRAFT_318674 [Basidiobolus meristosporus CBS 931.73]|uniref:BHLH domain-containing protein n=1 Tax=Basidiobolus meristosporus CBS 931.73 TaxID=1314790 RepID=A0A1Y1XUU1_9FUNG|nr:hypothetical protein K493DRAFT_318674 [Basidiobolus meristosporus CBS 931.73]|eukprot:ORX89445.1 hypothetical protein K493DRAFT_318674 [Basidiobolus meristosporus CBS 931.73]
MENSYNKGGSISMVVPTSLRSPNHPSGSTSQAMASDKPYPMGNPTVGTKLKLFRFENSTQGRVRKPRKKKKAGSYLVHGVNILNNDNTEHKPNPQRPKQRDQSKPKNDQPCPQVDPAVKKLVDMLPSIGREGSGHDTANVLKMAAEYLEKLRDENQNLRFENQLLKEYPQTSPESERHPSIVITSSENTQPPNEYIPVSARSSQVTSPYVSPSLRPMRPGSPLFNYEQDQSMEMRTPTFNSGYMSNSSSASSPSQTPPPHNLAPIRTDLPLLPPLTSFLQPEPQSAGTLSIPSSPVSAHSPQQTAANRNFIDHSPIQFAFSLSSSPKQNNNQSTFFNAYSM